MRPSPITTPRSRAPCKIRKVFFCSSRHLAFHATRNRVCWFKMALRALLSNRRDTFHSSQALTTIPVDKTMPRHFNEIDLNAPEQPSAGHMQRTLGFSGELMTREDPSALSARLRQGDSRAGRSLAHRRWRKPVYYSREELLMAGFFTTLCIVAGSILESRYPKSSTSARTLRD